MWFPGVSGNIRIYVLPVIVALIISYCFGTQNNLVTKISFPEFGNTSSSDLKFALCTLRMKNDLGKQFYF